MEYNITYRQKDGGWQYIISYKQNGKWKQRSKQGFRTRALAKKAADIRLDELKEQWEVQAEALPEHMDLTFKELADMYKDHKKIFDSFNTIKRFNAALNYFEPINNLSVKDIMPYHIQNCVDGMLINGLASSSIKTYTGVVKTCFNHAIDQYKIISINPVTNIRLTRSVKQSHEKNKIKALSKSELEDLLSKITNPKYYLMSLIAAKCGLRLGEIAGLTWDRIDLKKGTITVNRQWKALDEKEWGFGPPKSDNSYRTIPAPPVVITQLKNYRKLYPAHISGRLFPYNTTTSLSSSLLRYYQKLGYGISIHILRHTYATMLIGNGLDFKTVAELMGHDVEETIKTYSHVTDDMMANATKIINSVL